jgi:predicted Zn-dependent protease
MRRSLPRLIARTLLALTAVLVLAWVAVLLRDFELGHDAAVRAFFSRGLSQPERERDLKRLERAGLLNPDSQWDLARATYELVSGRPRRAERLAMELVQEEPENAAAWTVLLNATRRSDRRRAARAAAELRRLDPLGAGAALSTRSGRGGTPRRR